MKRGPIKSGQGAARLAHEMILASETLSMLGAGLDTDVWEHDRIEAYWHGVELVAHRLHVSVDDHLTARRTRGVTK